MNEVSESEITDVLLNVAPNVLLKADAECIAYSLSSRYVIGKKELASLMKDNGGSL